MEALFGEMSVPAKFILAFMIVLGLIGIAAFLMRRFSAGPLSMSGPRGRQPRLAVIDAANVDGRRRLVLIRRDNTEHLLMIGGPTDIVVEPNIVRAGVAAASRELRPGTAADALSRQSAAAREPDPLWQQPAEPMPRVVRGLDDVEPVRPDPLRADPLRADPLRPEPPLRPVREIAAGDGPVRGNRGEPGNRVAPPVPLERFQPDPIAEDLAAASLTPGLVPPTPAGQPAGPPDQKRAPIVQPPTPAQYEPVFQTALGEPKRPAPPLPPTGQAPSPQAPSPQVPTFETTGPSEPQSRPAQPFPTRETIYQSAVITESKRAQTTPPVPRPSQSDENNLAEMAQRLEAALRRPIKPVEPAPAPPPRVAAPVVAPVSRVAAYFETPAPTVPPPLVKDPEPAPEAKAVPAAKTAAPGAFVSLEEEMASLLGRSSGKT